MSKSPKTTSPLQGVRDGIMFLVGIGGIAHQTLLVQEPKPILIGAFLLMLGLPVSFLTDRLFQRPSSSQDDREDEKTDA